MSLSIIRARVELTNAQILTLPTAAVTIVAAPGSGYALNLLGGSLRGNFAAGAYTGASAALSYLYLRTPGNIQFSSYVVNDTASASPLSFLTTFLGATNKVTAIVPWQSTTDVAEDFGLIAPVYASFTLDNTRMELFLSNGGVDLGGGNAANKLIVTVYYTVEPIA